MGAQPLSRALIGSGSANSILENSCLTAQPFLSLVACIIPSPSTRRRDSARTHTHSTRTHKLPGLPEEATAFFCCSLFFSLPFFFFFPSFLGSQRCFCVPAAPAAAASPPPPAASKLHPRCSSMVPAELHCNKWIVRGDPTQVSDVLAAGKKR